MLSNSFEFMKPFLKFVSPRQLSAPVKFPVFTDKLF